MDLQCASSPSLASGASEAASSWAHSVSCRSTVSLSQADLQRGSPPAPPLGGGSDSGGHDRRCQRSSSGSSPADRPCCQSGAGKPPVERRRVAHGYQAATCRAANPYHARPTKAESPGPVCAILQADMAPLTGGWSQMAFLAASRVHAKPARMRGSRRSKWARQWCMVCKWLLQGATGAGDFEGGQCRLGLPGRTDVVRPGIFVRPGLGRGQAAHAPIP